MFSRRGHLPKEATTPTSAFLDRTTPTSSFLDSVNLTVVRTSPAGQEWEKFLPSGEKSADWCPKRGTRAGDFVEGIYRSTALARTGVCQKMVRIGADGDGGKNICLDGIDKDSCVVYSLGSRLDFTFETEILRKLGCTVHSFDCTVGSPHARTIPVGVQFHPWCVGGKDEVNGISSDLGHAGEQRQYFTLSTIMATLNHTRVDLVKMDIERHEFAVIASLTEGFAPAQIAFETHLHNAYGMWGGPVLYKQWEGLWQKLDQLGLLVVAHEPNPLCLCCCEFTVLFNQVFDLVVQNTQ